MSSSQGRGATVVVAIVAGLVAAMVGLVAVGARPTDEQGLVIHCPGPGIVLLDLEAADHYVGAHADNIGGTDVGFEPPSEAEAERLCEEASASRILPVVLVSLAAAMLFAMLWLGVRPIFDGVSETP